MFDNNVPVLPIALQPEQIEVAKALKELYIETDSLEVLSPTVIAKAVNGSLVTLIIVLETSTQSWSIDMLAGDIATRGELYKLERTATITSMPKDEGIEAIDNTFYVYCIVRVDVAIDAELPVTPEVIRGGFVDGDRTVTTVAVESPLELNLIGDSLSVNLDYLGLTRKEKETKNTILSINGMLPDDSGNINIKSYTPEIGVYVVSSSEA